jgi:hypothetical protein
LARRSGNGRQKDARAASTPAVSEWEGALGYRVAFANSSPATGTHRKAMPPVRKPTKIARIGHVLGSSQS